MRALARVLRDRSGVAASLVVLVDRDAVIALITARVGAVLMFLG